jgi:hypothetical protein
MERHQIIEAMTSLKLYGMRASFDEIAGKGLNRREERRSRITSRNCQRRAAPLPRLGPALQVPITKG